MLERRPIFPHVIEVNYQLQRVIGCNVYIVYDDDEWILIDTGYDDDAEEILELIRQLDFPYSKCRTVVASHADVDHVQGLARFKRTLRTTVTAHPNAATLLAAGDRLRTFAEIEPQGISLDMPAVEVDHMVQEGDSITVGGLELEVWHTPGHTDNQLAFRMGELLFSGDNIFADGCVGAIDAHHGSDLVAFVASLERIRDSGATWLLPSHGPIFRNDRALLDATIDRLRRYQHMADFGTCALDWPLIDRWEQELAEGRMPGSEESAD